jgi:PA domain/Secretion system C-terminal sorting domain
MKKLSLFMILAMIGTLSFGQVIFAVQAPSTPAGLLGNYANSWADPGGGDWTTPDLNIPANSVTAPLMFVAAPGGDTIACVPPLAANLTGMIAVVYRASCEFGAKALAAQNAGAVAVIIINNVGGGVIQMGGGASGTSVTIPVIMISDIDGALLRDAIVAGSITQGFIGSKLGLFADDLGAGPGDVVMSRRFSSIGLLSQNASEFSIPTGAWVRNYGNQTQNNASIAVDVNQGGPSIYNNSAAINGLAPGDSIYVSLGTFSQVATTGGYYTMNYTISTQNPDGDPTDNVINADFMIDANIYSYGRIDANTKLPFSPAGYRPGTFTTDYENCLSFDDPNASRVLAEGITFSAVTNTPDLLTNEFIEVRAYQWDDVFTDINDAGLAFANLTLLDQAFYVYTADLQDSNIFVPFNAPIATADNQRYLFCFNTSSTTLFLGFDNKLDYFTTQETFLQPSFPSTVDAQSSAFLNGFGTEIIPAITVTFQSATAVSEEVKDAAAITPYPNPVKDMISIPVGKLSGTAQLEIMDVAGKLVKSENVSFATNDVLKVDVSSMSNGSYVFKMTLEDGTTNTFNVIVNK